MSRIYKPVTDEISSIEELPLEDVYMYDIGMKDSPHTFFANNILVHNSLFLPILPLLNDVNIEELTDTELIELAKPLVKEVQEFINTSYTPYAKKFHMIDTHRWDIKQELIARRAFWITKKRYAQWIVVKEGFPIEKLDVKGLDVVRSSFPTAFRNLLKQVLIDILHDKSKKDLDILLLNFKKTVNTTELNNILFPTGAKEIKKYETGVIGRVKSGTPAHIKSAINYNHLMDLFNIVDIPKISDGDKILWGYLHNNPYNFESLAITGNFDDEKIIEFMEKYVDKNKIFESGLLKKLQAYWDAMGWGKITFNSNVNKFF